MDSDVVRHVFDAIVNDEENNETCVTVINVMNRVCDKLENQILIDSGDKKKTLSSNRLTKAQGEEIWIQIVKHRKE